MKLAVLNTKYVSTIEQLKGIDTTSLVGNEFIYVSELEDSVVFWKTKEGKYKSDDFDEDNNLAHWHIDSIGLVQLLIQKDDVIDLSTIEMTQIPLSAVQGKVGKDITGEPLTVNERRLSNEEKMDLLLQKAYKNPLINDDLIDELFEKYSRNVSSYYIMKYGYKNLIRVLQKEIDDDLEYKTFLITVANADVGYTVMQAIVMMLY